MYKDTNTVTRLHTYSLFILCTERHADQILPKLPEQSKITRSSCGKCPVPSRPILVTVATCSNAKIKAPECSCEIMLATWDR